MEEDVAGVGASAVVVGLGRPSPSSPSLMAPAGWFVRGLCYAPAQKCVYQSDCLDCIFSLQHTHALFISNARSSCVCVVRSLLKAFRRLMSLTSAEAVSTAFDCYLARRSPLILQTPGVTQSLVTSRVDFQTVTNSLIQKFRQIVRGIRTRQTALQNIPSHTIQHTA